MRLVRFRAINLNGYLDFDIQFNSDISFLIGINGSGKTSVLKAVVSLITPDIDWLFGATYDLIELEFSIDSVIYRLSSEKDDNKIILRFGKGEDTESTIVTKSEYLNYRRRKENYVYEEDGEVVRLQEVMTDFPTDGKILSELRSIPTPIFLGLDRTTLPGSSSGSDRYARASRRLKRPRSTIRAFLDESVAQAEILIGRAQSDAQRRRAALASRLREDILLSLFAATPETKSRPLPSREDIRKLERTRRSLKAAFTVLGLPAAKVEMTVDPFFSNLISLGEKIQNFSTVDDVIGKNAADETRNAFFAWISQEPRLSLLAHVEGLVTKFNAEEIKVFGKTNEYKSLIMSFFQDSRKEIILHDDGIVLQFENGRTGDIYQTSSGERQLFVLLTNLMFNEDKNQANVLIIDEPELSLHLKWQEMFVSAIKKANPNVQIILATHSPSIIMEYDNKCIDLS